MDCATQCQLVAHWCKDDTEIKIYLQQNGYSMKLKNLHNEKEEVHETLTLRELLTKIELWLYHARFKSSDPIEEWLRADSCCLISFFHLENNRSNIILLYDYEQKIFIVALTNSKTTESKWNVMIKSKESIYGRAHSHFLQAVREMYNNHSLFIPYIPFFPPSSHGLVIPLVQIPFSNNSYHWDSQVMNH